MKIGTRRVVWIVLALATVSMVAAMMLMATPANHQAASSQAVIVAPMDPDCDLHQGPCISQLPGGGRVELAVEPRPIALLQPLRLKVRVEDIDARSVEVDFSGIEMYMGYNRPRLERLDADHFQGEGMLPPLCGSKWMTWEARVRVKGEQGMLVAPFHFGTVWR